MDKPTGERIMRLHPSIRVEVTNIINQCNLELNGRAKVRITQGLRTNAEQKALFDQGRTKPGKVVTNSKAGQSVHNYGFAVDIVLIIDGKEISYDTQKDWDNDNISDWQECVKVFARFGWSWGGSWKTFKDFPHFEKIGYNNWRQLSRMKKAENGYVII